MQKVKRMNNKIVIEQYADWVLLEIALYFYSAKPNQSKLISFDDIE